MCQGGSINVLICPLPFIFGNQSVLEEPESLMRPDTHKTFHGQDFQRFNCFVNSAYPSSKFTRTVDVMGLNVCCEPPLRSQVEVHHGIGKGVGVCTEIGDDLEHGTRVCAINLLQRNLSRVVDHDKWGMAQETMTERDTARICGRIASAYKLNTLQLDPGHVGSSPEATGLDELTNERYDSLSSVFIGGWKVDLVTEYHKPATQLDGGKKDAIGSLPIFTILLEGLQYQFRGRRA